MEDAVARKYVNRMRDLRVYLETLVVSGFPIRSIREGLKYALEPVGIPVDVSSSPLLVGGIRRRKTRKLGKKCLTCS